MLTRKLAEKYFGTIDCLGQVIDVDHVHPMRVTGVAEDVPSNATETFSALLSGKTAWGLLAIGDANPPAPGELRLAGVTFVRLRSGFDPRMLAARLRDFVPAHYPDPDGPTPLFQSLFLHSMADVHLHPFNPDTSEPDDREQAVYAIAVTGLFILMLAGINFVNLVTARAACRAKEVGIRKAAGASRGQLMVQFMGEAVGYAFAGLLIGMGLAAILPPEPERVPRPTDRIRCLASTATRRCAASYRNAVRHSRWRLPCRGLVGVLARARAEDWGGRSSGGRAVASGPGCVSICRHDSSAHRHPCDSPSDRIRHLAGVAFRHGHDADN